MTKTGRRTKAGDLIIMVLVGALAYVGFGDRVSSLAWGLIAISVVLTWITFSCPPTAMSRRLANVAAAARRTARSRNGITKAR